MALRAALRCRTRRWASASGSRWESSGYSRSWLKSGRCSARSTKRNSSIRPRPTPSSSRRGASWRADGAAVRSARWERASVRGARVTRAAAEAVSPPEARSLVAARAGRRLAPEVVDSLVDSANGNRVALVELPGTLSAGSSRAASRSQVQCCPRRQLSRPISHASLVCRRRRKLCCSWRRPRTREIARDGESGR